MASRLFLLFTISSTFLKLVYGCAGGAGDLFGSTTVATTQAPVQTTPLTTPVTTEAATTTADPVAAACSAVAADFGNDKNGGWKTDKWQSSSKQFNNKDTGVNTPVSGKKSFLATTVKPNEKVELTSAPVSVSSPTQMWINYYEATDGVALQGCSNDANTNCQDISNVGIDKTDNRWRVGKYQITPDTKNVVLVAKNSGSNIGAVGLDSIGIGDGPDTDKCKSTATFRKH